MEVFGPDIASYAGSLARAEAALRMWEAHPHPDRTSYDYIEETKNLKQDVAYYKRMLQGVYEGTQDHNRLRAIARASADYIHHMGPVDAAAVHARNARLYAEADRLEQGKTAAQQKLERINFGPGEDGLPRRIPQDVIDHIHSYGRGRDAAARTMHAAQGARARAAVLQ